MSGPRPSIVSAFDEALADDVNVPVALAATVGDAELRIWRRRVN